MTAFVSAGDVSSAWLAAVKHLLSEPGGRSSNLGVSIAAPNQERTDVRRELEGFAANARRRGQDFPRIESVAGTIFQSSFYRPTANDPEHHLYDLERRIRKVVRRHPQNRSGTYFERLVAYPLADGREFNQLHHVLERLRSAATQGRRNGNQFELSIFHPERDSYPVGFPCLSHISITLRDGILDATALYRNQYFLERAYGNYVGIGEVMRFLATESGFGVGELLCVASHARLELGSYGRARVTALVDRCASLIGDDGS
jgi:thymidylate synthase